MKIIPKRKIRYPIGLERAYAKELVAHTENLMTVVRSFIPKMRNVLLSMSVAFDASEEDMPEDELSELMEDIADEVDKLPSMRGQVEDMYGRVYKHGYWELALIFDSVFGTKPISLSDATQPSGHGAGTAFNVARGETLAERLVQAEQFEQLKRIWVQENLDLIKSIDAETLRKIRETMADMIIGTVDRATLTKNLSSAIEQIAHVEGNRAALIGRDQVGKLNGRLAEYFQRQTGIEEYVWITAGDSRVRPAHRKRNGEIFKWADPPSDGHPGQPIQCRCVPVPVIDVNKVGMVPKAGNYKTVDTVYSDILDAYIDKRNMTPELESMFKKYITPENILVDYTSRIPMAYIDGVEKMIINPAHHEWNRYNLVDVLSHEIAHFIDFKQGVTINLMTTLDKTFNSAGQYILDHETKYRKLMSGRDGYDSMLSDIFSILTEGKVTGYYGHTADYLASQVGLGEREFVADIVAMLYTHDKRGLKVLTEIPGMQETIQEIRYEYKKAISS